MKGRRIIALVLLASGVLLGAQQPVVPTLPVLPVVPRVVPGTASAIPAAAAVLRTPWEAQILTPAAGTAIWRNGMEIPLAGSTRSWGSFELLTTGPGAQKTLFTGPARAQGALTLEPDTQVWWKGSAGGTGTLNLKILGGRVYGNFQGNHSSRFTLEAPDLTLSMASASFTLILETNGDFLLMGHSGIIDVVSEKYRFPMSAQRAYERIKGTPRYFETPFDVMNKTLQEWKAAAVARRTVLPGLKDLLGRESRSLDESFSIFQGWGGELQYWQNRMLGLTPLIPGEKTNALSRLEAPVREWEILVSSKEILAARFEESPELREPWSRVKTRWYNLLSQYRFALEIYNRLQAPLPPVAVPVPSPGASSNSLNDPTALLKSILDNLGTDSLTP